MYVCVPGLFFLISRVVRGDLELTGFTGGSDGKESASSV